MKLMVQLNWEISRLASTLRYKDFLLRNVPHTCPFQVGHSFQHLVSNLHAGVIRSHIAPLFLCNKGHWHHIGPRVR